MKFRTGFAAITLILMVVLCSSQTPPREQVGPLPNGGFLLSSGWRVKPAGVQISLDTLPMSCVLSKNGRFIIALNGGYRPPTLSVIDVSLHTVKNSAPLPDAWLGLALSPDGKTIWVGGGASASIYEFALDDSGNLTPGRTFTLVKVEQRTPEDFIGDVQVSPDGHLLYAADMFHDAIVVVNTQSGIVVARHKTGRRPYRILFAPDGNSYFVTSWTDGTLHQHQTSNGASTDVIRIGAHPTDMILRPGMPADADAENGYAARIFVAAANTNNVYSVALGSSGTLRPLETINVATSPMHPLGMTPSALALSPNQKTLYVVCSDANALAVADITEARTHVLGFIPTGWYPTAVRTLTDGSIVVLNGKGQRSFPNPDGPGPMKAPEGSHLGSQHQKYGPAIQTGTASIIPPPSEEELVAYTREAIENSPYNDTKLEDQGRGAIPSDIQHVLYIVKENRTYDQVLGDLGKGASDPSLVLFDEKVGPNHHKLAREFVLLDNFYVNGDVSADGHHWSTSAIANDYVQKFWPNSYARRRRKSDYEGQEPTAKPPAGFIWTNAAAKGISMRNYGYWVTNAKDAPPDSGVQIEKVLDPVLVPVTNTEFRSFDLDYPDVKRAQVFLKDLANFERTGQMPSFMIMRLGNDHTAGTTPGKIAPLSAFADNDYALGMIVEGVSKSRFWKNTVIFVVEDDAQNGPDHIDSHRSPAYVLSPYTHRAVVDSTMYNTTSVLRTMELILGMRPMTHFDAGARPMFSVFGKDAVMTPYVAEKPRISLTDRNASSAIAAGRSARLDFSEADLNDDDELNDILWRAIRGTDPPAPTRSLFVR